MTDVGDRRRARVRARELALAASPLTGAVAALKRLTGARTWHLEAAFAAAALAGVALAVHKGAREWVGVAAVFVTFMHMQVSARLAEGAAGQRTDVDCHRWAGRYLVAKELLWIVYFTWLGAWSALAGCALFIGYGAWRRAWIGRSPP